MKIFYFLVSIIVCVSFFISCESEYVILDDEGTYLKDTVHNTVDTVYFGTEILPILQNNCGSCHFAGTVPDLESPDLYNNLINGNYLNIAEPESSTFFTLPDPGHADDYLSPEQHILIVKWIEQGALNN